MPKVENKQRESGIMDPAFLHRERKEIRAAMMELQGKMLTVWADGELIGQSHKDHPGIVRHLDLLEQIFDIRIENKSWMLREVMNNEKESS